MNSVPLPAGGLESIEEMVQLMKQSWITGQPKIPAIRTPLFLALTVSPLVLFIPKKLDGKKTGVEKMYEVCISIISFLEASITSLQFWLGFGRSKPNCLLQAEKKIWKLVWAASEDPGFDLLAGIKDTIADILPFRINAGRQELEWFQTCR